MKSSTPALATAAIALSLVATPVVSVYAAEAEGPEHSVETEGGTVLEVAPAPAPLDPPASDPATPGHTVESEEGIPLAPPAGSEHTVENEAGVALEPAPAPAPLDPPASAPATPGHTVENEDGTPLAPAGPEHTVEDEDGNVLEDYVPPTEVDPENPADYQPRPNHEVILTPETLLVPAAPISTVSTAADVKEKTAESAVAAPLRLATTGATTGLTAAAAIALAGLGAAAMRRQRRR